MAKKDNSTTFKTVKDNKKSKEVKAKVSKPEIKNIEKDKEEKVKKPLISTKKKVGVAMYFTFLGTLALVMGAQILATDVFNSPSIDNNQPNTAQTQTIQTVDENNSPSPMDPNTPTVLNDQSEPRVIDNGFEVINNPNEDNTNTSYSSNLDNSNCVDGNCDTIICPNGDCTNLNNNDINM